MKDNPSFEEEIVLPLEVVHGLGVSEMYEPLVSGIDTQFLRDIRGYESRILRRCLNIPIEYGKTGRTLIQYFRNTSSQAGPKTSDYFCIVGADRAMFPRILTQSFGFWRSESTLNKFQNVE